MKPGKPLTFAEILPGSTEKGPKKKILAFGLPGNPVSCLVCFHLFVVPTIRHLSGWTQPHFPRFSRVVYLFFYLPIILLSNIILLLLMYLFGRVHARLKQSIKADRVRTEFHRASVRWELDSGSQISG